jgi:hypothetical protein
MPRTSGSPVGLATSGLRSAALQLRTRTRTYTFELILLRYLGKSPLTQRSYLLLLHHSPSKALTFAANEHLRISGILESGFVAIWNQRDTTNIAVKERRLVRPGDYISVVNGVSGHTLLLRNEIRARSVTWFHITIVRMCRRPAAVALGGPAPAEVVHVPAPVPPQPKAVGVVAHDGLVLDHFESRAFKRPRVEQSDSIPSSMASSAPLCHLGLMSQSLWDSIQEHALSALDLCPLRLNDSLEHIVLQYFSGSSDGQTT